MKLTNRELEILSLIAQGLSDKEIIERLNIAFSTLRTHKMNIYEKLCIRYSDKFSMRVKATLWYLDNVKERNNNDFRHFE